METEACLVDAGVTKDEVVPNQVKEGDHGRGDLKDGDFHCCYLLVTISE